MIAKAYRWVIPVLGVVALAALPACKTDDPAVRSSYRSQWANVQADTQEATESAREVLEDLNLRNIEAAATAVDGEAIGYTADGTKITVSVARVDQNTSQVSVNVGTLGDPDLGSDILRRIREDLND